MAQEIDFDNCDEVNKYNETNELHFLPSDVLEKHIEHAFLEYVQQMVQRFRERDIEGEIENLADVDENENNNETIIQETARTERNSIENDNIEMPIVSRIEEQNEYQEISTNDVDEDVEDVYNNLQDSNDTRPI